MSMVAGHLGLQWVPRRDDLALEPGEVAHDVAGHQVPDGECFVS
jgi:hypothetical protein